MVLMCKASRDKGKRGEREVVNLLKAEGHHAQRTAPLQAAEGDDSGADVLLDDKYKIEVKRRKNGFKTLYDYIENVDFVFMRADRKKHIVAMSVETFLELYSAAKKNSKSNKRGGEEDVGKKF